MKVSILSGVSGSGKSTYIDSVAKDVFVDNTNTTVRELAPYVLGAEAYSFEVEIITFMCVSESDVKVCAARNSHDVPLEGVMAQHKRLQERTLPSFWSARTIRVF